MIPGINQWSLPLEKEDTASVLKHSVRSGLANIELCVKPVDPKVIGAEPTDEELNQLFADIARAVNATDYLLDLFSPENELDSLKETFSHAGASIVSVTTLDLFRYTITSDDSKIRHAAIRIIERMIDMCSYLGGRMILIEPGVVTSSLPYAEAYKNCRDSLKGLAKYAEEKNVVLALENVWGKFLMSPIEFRALIDEINSDAVGVYFDVANILEYGFPQDWIQIMGRRIAGIHFKDYKRGAGALGFCNPFDGDVDWPSVRRSLEAIEYKGYVIAEALKPNVAQDEFIADLGRKVNYFINEL